MSSIDLSLFKTHCRADDFAGDDSYLQHLLDTAEAHIANATHRTMEELEEMGGGELSPDYSVEWNIRDAHEVHENWRVEQLGGNLYTVTYIIPNYDRGYLTLVCDKVNE